MSMFLSVADQSTSVQEQLLKQQTDLKARESALAQHQSDLKKLEGTVSKQKKLAEDMKVRLAFRV